MNAPSRRRLTLAALVLSAVPATAALAATPPDQIDRLTHPAPAHVPPDQVDRLTHHVTVTTLGSTQRVSHPFTTPDQSDRSAEAKARARAGLSLSTSRTAGVQTTTPDQADRSAEAKARARAGLSLSSHVRRAHVLP